MVATQRRVVAGRIAERKKILAQSIDALNRRIRLTEERAGKAAEKAYEKGNAEGWRMAERHHKKMTDMRMWFKEREHRLPPALLARPQALLSGLRKKFPKDRFKLIPKGNGIIQTIRYNGNDAGSIVYVCRPDAGWLEELDTRQVEALKGRCRARAGIQVVRNARNNACGCGIFIICQKTVLSFAAVVREGVLLSARMQEDSAQKHEILSRFTV
ncbi:MAG: hypothetical protein JXA71_03625 [Chitinispirillaceae bacterium]|nr:hypothetical protein [Chitinispirillaceae bacterium]